MVCIGNIFFFALSNLKIVRANNSSEDIVLKLGLTSILQKFLVEYCNDFIPMYMILDDRNKIRFKDLIMNGIPSNENISFNNNIIDAYIIPFVYADDKQHIWKFTPSLFCEISRQIFERIDMNQSNDIIVQLIRSNEMKIINPIISFGILQLEIYKYCTEDVIKALSTFFEIKPFGKFINRGLELLSHLEVMGKFSENNTSDLKAACEKLQYGSIVKLIDNYNKSK